MTTQRRWTNQEVAQAIRSEGELGYVVQHYLPLDRIADTKLRDLCVRAKDCLDRIEEMLQDQLDDED
jgi:hypothetical protein